MLPPYLVIKIFILHLNDLSCTHFYFFFFLAHFYSLWALSFGVVLCEWEILPLLGFSTEIAVTLAVTYNIIKFLVEKQKNFLLYLFSGVKRHTITNGKWVKLLFYWQESKMNTKKCLLCMLYIFFLKRLLIDSGRLKAKNVFQLL